MLQTRLIKGSGQLAGLHLSPGCAGCGKKECDDSGGEVEVSCTADSDACQSGWSCNAGANFTCSGGLSCEASGNNEYTCQ